MFENLLRHILALPEEKLHLVQLEEMALCAAWFDSCRDNPGALAPFAGLRVALDSWVNSAAPRADNTEGVRQQPLLRHLISDIIQGRMDALARDELDVIYFAWGLMERSGRDDLFERPIQTLKPFISKVRKARENLPVVAGLGTIAGRFNVVLTEDFPGAQPRDVKSFAGLDLAFRGPAIVRKGDVKVLGDVPDFAAVVAEGGGCYVDGAIHGYAAASDGIEVYENITGTAVARRGAVRCASILNHAIVISKEENVACISGEEPRLVFGGRQTLVRGSITGGTWMSRDLQVGGDIAGGDLQVSRKAVARCFRTSEERPLSIVLRRSLGCQDYGELLTQDAVKAITAAMKLRQQAAHLEKLEALTRREADDFAGSILLFLFGEDNTREQIDRIQLQRRRASFMSRLNAGIQNLIAAIEDRLSFTTTDERGGSSFSVAGADDSSRSVIEELERELNLIESEGPLDRACHVMRDETFSLGRNISRRAITEKRLYEILNDLLLKESSYTNELRELELDVRQREAALEHAIGRTAILEKAREECARVEIMNQLVRAGKSKGGQDRVRRRVSDRFVKLLQRNILNRQARCNEYGKSIEQCETKIRALRDRLWDEYQVSLPMHVIEDGLFEGAQVHGVFETGVVICAWKHLLEDRPVTDPGFLMTPESNGTAATYARTPSGAVEAC